MEMRRVIPFFRSRMNTFLKLLVAVATRFVEYESKTTKRPSADTDGTLLSMSACCSVVLTLTRRVTFDWRSRMKMSLRLFVSPGTRFVADETKTT